MRPTQLLNFAGWPHLHVLVLITFGILRFPLKPLALARTSSMAKQHISLGSAPADEPCAQLGTEGYEILAWDECSRYVKLLQHFYAANRGVMPASLQLKVVENPH